MRYLLNAPNFVVWIKDHSLFHPMKGLSLKSNFGVEKGKIGRNWDSLYECVWWPDFECVGVRRLKLKGWHSFPIEEIIPEVSWSYIQDPMETSKHWMSIPFSLIRNSYKPPCCFYPLVFTSHKISSSTDKSTCQHHININIIPNQRNVTLMSSYKILKDGMKFWGRPRPIQCISLVFTHDLLWKESSRH